LFTCGGRGKKIGRASLGKRDFQGSTRERLNSKKGGEHALIKGVSHLEEEEAVQIGATARGRRSSSNQKGISLLRGKERKTGS